MLSFVYGSHRVYACPLRLRADLDFKVMRNCGSVGEIVPVAEVAEGVTNQSGTR